MICNTAATPDHSARLRSTVHQLGAVV